MPPIPGHWHSLITRHAKSLKAAFQRVSKALDAQVVRQPQSNLQPVLARHTPKQPLHPLARIRQSQSRWFSSTRQTIRSFTSGGSHGAKYDRASLPRSRTSNIISQSSGRAPFASTLRPNLTGGTLGRTAGGYALGSGRVGGARYFSHGPAAQSQVVQNVSQAMRAFFTQGHKAQFDGYSSRSGGKRYKTTTATQYEASCKLQSLPKSTPGSWIEFQVNPTITALTPLSAIAGYSTSQEMDHLNTDGLIDCLSADFSRSLKDLAIVLNDLKRLSTLGDLPITCEGSCLRVYFPGCDADTVNILCDELNIQRGTVVQDERFDAFAGTEIALLFPFAPSKPASDDDCDSLFEMPHRGYSPQQHLVQLDDLLTLSPSEDMAYSTQSALSDGSLEDVIGENPWVSSPSGYESVRSGSDYGSNHSPLEYQGFEGIYRFIEQCDAARRR